MAKILISGNGFDLSYGLPTKYSDFINILEIIKRNENYTFEKIYSKTSNFKILKNNFNEFSLDKEKLSDLKKMLSENSWFSYFLNELKIETWIDFENKIEFVLNKIYTGIKITQNKIFKNGAISTDLNSFISSNFSNDIEFLSILDDFKVISNEKGRIVINPKFLVERYNLYLRIDYDCISEHLQNELIEFKKIFNKYFDVIVLPFYENIKSNLKLQNFNKIEYHYTFNYTPTFEKLYNKKITVHLHGKINDPENEIVLGINDISKIDNNEKKKFIPFTKAYQKFSGFKKYTFIENFKSNSSSNKDIIFFIGHSLDESDKIYINQIFDYITKSIGSVKKIIIIYHDIKCKNQLIINLINIRGENNIQKLLEKDRLQFIHKDSKELNSFLDYDTSSSSFLSSRVF